MNSKHVVLIAFVVPLFLAVLCGVVNLFHDKKDVSNQNIIEKVVVADACEAGGQNCLKNVVLVTGLLDQETTKDFNALLETNIKFDTICFSSPGGYSDTAIPLMDYVRKNKLNTCMAEEYYSDGVLLPDKGKCKSSCPFILLMGQERHHLGKNIDIGIHHTGRKLDLCVTCFFINWGGEEFRPYFTDQQHISMYDRSRKTHITKMDNLHHNEWSQYNIFTISGIAN